MVFKSKQCKQRRYNHSLWISQLYTAFNFLGDSTMRFYFHGSNYAKYAKPTAFVFGFVAGIKAGTCPLGRAL